METLLETTASTAALLAAGVFFLSGLLTGSWKYRCMRASDAGMAPHYVDIAHRAALTYSFAALLLAVFAALSAFPAWMNTIATLAPLAFFALSIGQYVLLGISNETDNQIRDGGDRAAAKLMFTLLEISEIGGFAVLFSGIIWRVVSS